MAFHESDALICKTSSVQLGLSMLLGLQACAEEHMLVGGDAMLVCLTIKNRF